MRLLFTLQVPAKKDAKGNGETVNFSCQLTAKERLRKTANSYNQTSQKAKYNAFETIKAAILE